MQSSQFAIRIALGNHIFSKPDWLWLYLRKIFRGRGTSFFPVKHEKLPPSYFQDAKNFSVVKPLNSSEARASPVSPVPRPLPTTHESCKERCWTSYDPQASCQCNSICRVHGNCCLDINLCPIEACKKLCIWDNCTMMQNAQCWEQCEGECQQKYSNTRGFLSRSKRLKQLKYIWYAYAYPPSST